MNVLQMTFADRIGEVFRKTSAHLKPEFGKQLEALVEPTSLAIIATTLGAWAISHAFGVGEAIDLILGVVGVFSLGLAVFSGLDHLTKFALETYNASVEADLDKAAADLAEAIAILGIAAVLSFLFKGRSRVRRVDSGAPPPRTPGLRYEPTTTYEPLPRGTWGVTDSWGNITISTLRTASEQKIAMFHESFHRFLTPKFYLLREFRVNNRDGSYVNSSLWRYLEEAIAQTVGKIGGEGFSQVFAGVRFPVQNGYVYLIKAGNRAQTMGGTGVLTEGAGLIATGFMGGMQMELWFKPGVQSSTTTQGGPR